MTVLPAHPAPTSPAPTRASRLSTHADRERLVAAGLGPVIVAGLRALDDLRHLSRDVTSGDLALTLHSAMARHQQRVALAPASAALARVALALRIASAHLDAGNLVETRVALHGAHEALPHRDRQVADADTDDGDTGRVANRARAASEVQRRSLDAAAVLAQAAGVLAEHTGADPGRARAALRRHAARHGVVLDELAHDVVAGRVAPTAILGPVRRAPTVGRRRTT